MVLLCPVLQFRPICSCSEGDSPCSPTTHPCVSQIVGQGPLLEPTISEVEAVQPVGSREGALEHPKSDWSHSYVSDTLMPTPASMHRSRDPHASSAYPCAARTIASRSRTPARAQHAPHRRFSHECTCGRDVEVSRTIKRYPTDVGGRWLAAIVLRHRRRPEEASK